MAVRYATPEADPVAAAALAAHAATDASDAELAAETARATAAEATKQDALAGTVDTVTSRVLLTPTSPGQNAVVVKAPDSTWGDSNQPYGTGQAFMLLREDYAEAPNGGLNQEPDKNVLMRVNGGDGSVGTAGNLHVATGLRQRTGYGTGPDTGGGCIHVQPYVDVPIISLAPVVPLTKPYLRCYNSSGVIVAALNSAGQLQLNTQGSTGGLLIGGEVSLYRSASNLVSLTGSLTVDGPSLALAPSTPTDVTAQFLSGSAAKFSVLQVGRVSGEGQMYVAPSANFIFTGEAAGDISLRAIAGKLHIGVASGAAEIRVGDNLLGFHGTAPIAKATVSGSRGANAALASLLTALANKGLITDSSTA